MKTIQEATSEELGLELNIHYQGIAQHQMAIKEISVELEKRKGATDDKDGSTV